MSTAIHGNNENVRLGGLILALVGYTALFVAKLVAYFITDIGVMYAEALHSLSDILISTFLLIATLWSRKPANNSYPYGYGRAQNVAALVAATVFISVTGFEVFRSAILKISGHFEAEYSNFSFGIIVLAISIIVSAIPLIKIKIDKAEGATNKAQFIESINDEIALIAALVGTILVSQGYLIADAIASIIVALIIVFNAGMLWIENAKYLVGCSPEPAFYQRVEEVVKSIDGVIDVHDMKADYIGDDVRLDLHIEVAKGTPIEEADRISEEVHKAIDQSIEHAYCIIHVDPEGVKVEQY